MEADRVGDGGANSHISYGFAVIWCFLMNTFILSSILRILLDQYLET